MISLMIHATEIILKVILEGVRNIIKTKIAEEQYGFIEKKEHGMRMLTERSIEMKHYLHLCFTDYEKAFDRLKYARLVRMLQEVRIDGFTIY